VGSRLRPFGKAPLEIDQVYGPVPPVPARLAEYGSPDVPEGKDVVVIPMGRIVRVKSWVTSGETPLEAVIVIG
jgi:hypothetical protein